MHTSPWYKEPAQRGDPDAQHVLGQLYMDGSGGIGDVDDYTAAAWFEKSALQGNDILYFIALSA